MTDPRMLGVGLIQMRGGVDPEANILAAEALIREAVAKGAELIAAPECANLVQRDADALRAAAPAPDADAMLAALRELASDLKVWILAGSLMQRRPDGKIANRAYLVSSAGEITATYDKIHLFDVTVADGETYAESRSISPGDRAVVGATPWGGLGLTICYDVRFPHLHRDLAKAGAAMIAVPAAFTRHTGRAHWETLLRARAIETGCFILAPAQGGRHEDGRATWGRSMVVGPWGEVIAALDHDNPGVLLADLDLSEVDKARGKIPALRHDRPYAFQEEPS